MASMSFCCKLKEKLKVSWEAGNSIPRSWNCMIKAILTICISKDRKKFEKQYYSEVDQRLKRLQSKAKYWRERKRLWKFKLVISRLQHSRLRTQFKYSVAFALWLKENEQSRIERGAAKEYRETSYMFSQSQVFGTCSPSTESLERMLNKQMCLSPSKS